ncbi:dolichol phosphate-mannose biosynthesis regulatory protein [Melanotaenia boesemani]|uniref:dolichol phosphate-mannose biosynthesis regulatory protein n=1 Tax=Melanotaenia boesemani TaxID=1250792 RepID=UPI001C0424EA|nr:dolichol phosphate-mannose biosynthesis regulatory protein [Melanotaenia boesemani]
MHPFFNTPESNQRHQTSAELDDMWIRKFCHLIQLSGGAQAPQENLVCRVYSAEEEKREASANILFSEMATGVDQVAGMSLVVSSLLLFTYYSVWVIILPFVDRNHMLQKYFLPREYSVILPGIAAVILLLCIGAFTAVVVWKNRKPRKVD